MGQLTPQTRSMYTHQTRLGERSAKLYRENFNYLPKNTMYSVYLCSCSKIVFNVKVKTV